jgi:hypothetical protein
MGLMLAISCVFNKLKIANICQGPAPSLDTSLLIKLREAHWPHCGAPLMEFDRMTTQLELAQRMGKEGRCRASGMLRISDPEGTESAYSVSTLARNLLASR